LGGFFCESCREAGWDVLFRAFKRGDGRWCVWTTGAAFMSRALHARESSAVGDVAWRRVYALFKLPAERMLASPMSYLAHVTFVGIPTTRVM
jgi:hypothetical protein